jgi:opacity protein-like surface antigen
MRRLFLFWIAALPAFSQPFSFGVKAGVPLTDFLNTASNGHLSYFTNTNRYIVGVTGELHLPFGLGVELDVLYRHLNYQSTSMGVDTFSTSSTTGNAWEFPLLAKYRFPAKIVRPYIDAGVAWDTLQGLKQSITSVTIPGLTSTSSTSNPSELQHNGTTGFVVGAGIDAHLLVIHLTPEIRFTHWGSAHFSDPLGLLTSNQNQAEFLLGITF